MHSLKNTLLRGCFAGILAALAMTGTAQAGFYATFDVPGAGTERYQGTFPTAIGGGKIVAGYYVDGGNVSHSFFGTADSGIVTFDAPGAGTSAYQGTSANSVNAAGVITGIVIGATQTQGFVRDASGNFQLFDAGTNHQTRPMAINSKGVVTGYNMNDGFVRTPDGTVTVFDVPGSVQTFAFAINGKGVVTGFYYDNSYHLHGFTRSPNGKKIATFDAPGFTNTYPRSINSKGDITGFAYTDSTTQAFLRKADGTITTFAPLGCETAMGMSIAFDGSITGYCSGDDRVNYGFLRQPDGSIALYDVPGAGTIGGKGTYALALAANGKSIGNTVDNNGVSHGYRRNAGN